jgi:hypothetical protein
LQSFDSAAAAPADGDPLTMAASAAVVQVEKKKKKVVLEELCL